MNREFYVVNGLLFNTLFLFAAERVVECAVIPSVDQPNKISLRCFTKETRGLSKRAKQLYGQAMSYDGKHKSLDQSLPIAQKIEFDNAINGGLYSEVCLLLKKHEHLRKEHVIGSALWRVWKENAKDIELDNREFRFMQVQSIIFMTKELAIDAKNEEFLRSYCLQLKTNNEMRKIVFPFLYEDESFDDFLYIHCENIFDRAEIKINIKALIG